MQSVSFVQIDEHGERSTVKIDRDGTVHLTDSLGVAYFKTVNGVCFIKAPVGPPSPTQLFVGHVLDEFYPQAFASSSGFEDRTNIESMKGFLAGTASWIVVSRFGEPNVGGFRRFYDLHGRPLLLKQLWFGNPDLRGGELVSSWRIEQFQIVSGGPDTQPRLIPSAP